MHTSIAHMLLFTSIILALTSILALLIYGQNVTFVRSHYSECARSENGTYVVGHYILQSWSDTLKETALEHLPLTVALHNAVLNWKIIGEMLVAVSMHS